MAAQHRIAQSRYRYALLLVGAAVSIAVWWLPMGAPSAATAPLDVLVAVLAAGFLGAGYGTRTGRGLGLGAMALPPLLHWVGSRLAIPAVLALLVCSRLLLELRRRPDSDRSRGGVSLFEDSSPEAWAEVLGVRMLATAAAGFAWSSVLGAGEGPFRAGLASGAVYFLLLIVAEVVRFSTAEREPLRAGMHWDLLYEVGAWSIGVLAVGVSLGAGNSVAIGLLGAVAILSLELARIERRRRIATEGAQALQEVHLAGHRIIFGESEPLAIARQIFGECRRLVTFSWFQLALLDSNGEEQSWFSGPDGWVREGVPEPPPRPAALPGIHRRVSWQMVERELSVPGRRLGSIRMWCDPRKQRPGAVGWLDSLLPQMASSVHSVVLDREARQDPLTGLADRRALEERLQNTHAQAVESGVPMAVVMCDLDRFKRINDLYGHATGDQALMAVAAVLEAHRRERDLCCRYGGEEFAVVLEATDGEVGLQVAERLRAAVAELTFKPHGKQIKLQVSAGVASFPELYVKDAGELLELADEALYKAKKTGRNRCLRARGGGRFETTTGEIVGSADPPPQPPIPTLFA